MDDTARALHEKLETLKDLLVAVATGTAATVEHSARYRALRKEFLADAGVSVRLPGFVRTCRVLVEYWAFIKGKFGTYAERREFLRAEFGPALSYLVR